MVRKDIEKLFKEYDTLSGSHNGKYINIDLAKEVFPDYGVTKETHTKYNRAISPAASDLTDALFLRAVKKFANNNGIALLITGLPGAGKTTAIKRNSLFNFEDYSFIFEGALDNYDKAKLKIDMCLDADFHVHIYVFHRTPEKALDNTYARFNETGRGAFIGTMARIQGGLAETIPRLVKEYKAIVKICVIDLDEINEVSEKCGDDGISIVIKEGTTNDIDTRLSQKLARDFKNGTIGKGTLRQAAGDRISEFTNSQEVHGESSFCKRRDERSTEEN